MKEVDDYYIVLTTSRMPSSLYILLHEPLCIHYYFLLQVREQKLSTLEDWQRQEHASKQASKQVSKQQVQCQLPCES